MPNEPIPLFKVGELVYSKPHHTEATILSTITYDTVKDYFLGEVKYRVKVNDEVVILSEDQLDFMD